MNENLILQGFEEKKKLTLDNLEVSPLVSFYYIKAGYKTVGDLLKANKEDLLNVVKDHISGKLLYDELVIAIHDLGVFFLFESADISLGSQIKDLNLTTRSYSILYRNCRKQGEICYGSQKLQVMDVLNYEIKDLLRFRGAGIVSCEEIVTKIHSLGYLFNGEVGYLEQFKNDEIVTVEDLQKFDKSLDDFSHVREKIKTKQDLLESLEKLERRKAALLIDEKRLDKELVNIIERLSLVNGEKYVRGRK